MTSWQTRKLSDWNIKVIDGDRGKNYPNQSELNSVGYCLFLSATNVTKQGFKFNELVFIDTEKDQKLGKGKLQRNDIVLTTRGTVGNIAFYSDEVGFRHIRINSGMAIIRNNSESGILTRYLLKYLNSPVHKREMDRVVFGSAQPQITIATINKFPISAPEKPEQERIVGVLGVWDEYIEKLEQKIALKEQLKKGLMQQLLTGQMRLPGFHEDWHKYELGELLKYEQPGPYIVNSADYGDTGIPVLTANKSFILGYTDEKAGVYQNTNKGVIIFDDFTMASKFVTFDFKVKSSAIKILKPAVEDVSIKFIYERMQLISTVVGEHKRNYISEYQFNAIALPSREEQDAIASVAESLDDQINLLVRKKNEVKLQKKYLLKNLITGVIRTPETLVPEGVEL